MKYLTLNLIILLSSILNIQASQAIKVGKARISLVDLGANIKSEPSIAQKQLINVYSLSANIDRSKKSVLAIQGLQEQGETSFFVDTEFGVKNIKVQLDKNSSEIEYHDMNRSKTTSYKTPYPMHSYSSMRVTSPYYINDYVLAGDPELLTLDPFSDYYDENYLKNFIINAKEIEAKTEIIVPTTNQVFKFTIEIDKEKGRYDNALNLI